MTTATKKTTRKKTAAARPAKKTTAKQQQPVSSDEPSLIWLNPDHLDVHPDNPRKDLGDLDELVASIQAQGIVQPLTVAPHGEKGELVVLGGQRRLAASRIAGLERIPAFIRPDLADRASAIEAMVVENLQRADVAIVDEAHAFKQLADLGIKQGEIAEKVGCSQAHVSKSLALLALPEAALELLADERISKAQAVDLVRIGKASDVRLEKVLANIDRAGIVSPAGADTYIRNELATIEAAERRRKRIEGLTRDGVTIFEKLTHYGWHGEAARPLGGQHQYPELATVTEKTHKAEPCHAAWVDQGGAAVYVCTDPDKHEPKLPVPKASKEDAAERMTPEQKAHRELHAQLLEQQKIRRTFARLLVDSDTDALHAFARHLMLVLVAPEGSDVFPQADVIGPLVAPDDITGLMLSQPLRATAAFAVAAADNLLAAEVNEDPVRWWDRPVRPSAYAAVYLNLLESIGYAPTERDRAAAALPCAGQQHKAGDEHEWHLSDCRIEDRPSSLLIDNLDNLEGDEAEAVPA